MFNPLRSLRVFLSRLVEPLRKGRREQDLADELESHLEMLVEDNLRAGLSPAEAHRQARLRFAGMEEVKERQREARGMPLVEGLVRDLRQGLRLLVRAPAFSAVVILSLALGIGANSGIFAVLNALTLRPLALPQAHQLSRLTVTGDASTPAGDQLSYPVYQQLRGSVPPGASLSAMSRVANVAGTIEAGAQPASLRVQLVSADWFGTLGLTPALGRFLDGHADGDPGASPVAVLSHAFWQRRFGGAVDVVGHTVVLNDARFMVVGVAPPGFRGVWLESPVDLFVPLSMQATVGYAQNFSSENGDGARPWLLQRQIRWLDVLLRADDRQRPAALSTLAQTHRQTLASEVAEDPWRRRQLEQQRLGLEPFARGFSSLRGRFLSPLLVLMGMVGVLLLIACANTANLLLARGARRQRELALRLSLGATRGRLVQQLATEALVLAVIGTLLGLLLAPAAAELLIRMVTGTEAARLPFDVGLDGRVVLFTALVGLGTSLLFGLQPALRSTRPQVASTLRAGARGVVGGGSRPAKVLVMAQVALSLVLVVGAGLFLRSLRALHTMDVGFARDHLVSVGFSAGRPGGSAADPGQSDQLHRRLVQRALALPGVRAASVAACGLVSNCRSTSNHLSVSGYQRAPGESISARINRVGPGYFQTVGIPLVAGRDFADTDGANAPSVAIVNEAFARRYFDGRPAVGQRYGGGTPRILIVGVVKDARTSLVQEAPLPTVYHPLAQDPVGGAALEVHTAGDPGVLAASLRRVLAAEPGLTIERVRTIAEQVERSLTQERALARLTTVLGLLALGLACIGLYGLMSYAVASRTAEIGIRTALGATSAQVRGMVLGESLRLVAVGLAAGVTLVLLVGPLIADQLHGVAATDLGTLLLSALVLLLVATVAAYLPARRASRVDPLVALRAE